MNGAEATFAEAEAGSWAEQATAYTRAQGRLVFDNVAELHAYLSE